jgi:hypothetical protein
MSFLDADRASRVSRAYRSLGIQAITSNYLSASSTFARHRRRVTARDEQLALTQEMRARDPRLDLEIPFPLMDLPAEIRVRIFEYALVLSRRVHFEVMRTPSLACVSKQVRQECLPIFLRVNIFQTSYSRGLDGTFGIVFANETIAWLKELPLTAKLIRDIRVTFQGHLGRDDDKSSAFQIIANSSRVSINHFDRRCPFCIDGRYGDDFKLPHPSLDHPACPRTNTLQKKHAHDECIRHIEEGHFKRSADWGCGGLSITDIIDLGKVADDIRAAPDLFITFCRLVQKLDNYAEIMAYLAANASETLVEERREQWQQIEHSELLSGLLDQATVPGDP